MWSAFGADVSILVSRGQLTLRRAPLFRRWKGTAAEQRTVFDPEGFTPAEPLELRRGDRVTVYVGDRLCDLYELPLAEGVKNEELLAFAVAACARREPSFDAAEAQCVADKIGSGKFCVLAALPRGAFDAFAGMARTMRSELVSMQPWCSAVINHWVASKNTGNAAARWLILLEPDVCTVAAAANGVLMRIARLPRVAGQQPTAVLRSAAVACEVDTEQADVWLRGDDVPDFQTEPLTMRGDRAFLHTLKRLAGVP